ncbi:Hypothetical Protein FCC1311_017442 [Hondaea fermentalgiana]|uniref:PH domain-containing protein n=1 Tax=Hondaea fermentalgiana TaxID=2315210 RepID=A0A2R5G4P0_9STRA|nr:Hypothetical Protein FCC1311_017442 [Hondaea fermentalgiana]|eukprot:GBG25525.1 Hypothetical Protein FCC1311_017442 [Hondaea fermentalgiana]
MAHLEGGPTNVQTELQNLTRELAREVHRHRSALALLRSTDTAGQTAGSKGSSAGSGSSSTLLAQTASFTRTNGDFDVDVGLEIDTGTSPNANVNAFHATWRDNLSLMKPGNGAQRDLSRLSRRLSDTATLHGGETDHEEPDTERTARSGDHDADSVASPGPDAAAEACDMQTFGSRRGSSPPRSGASAPHDTESSSLSPAGSSSRVLLSKADGNQSFFLHAVFDLVKSKLEWEMQVLESLRVKYPELPASNEAIMYGHLRKGKGLNVRSKFVLISPGLMTYLTSSAAPGLQDGSAAFSSSSSASPLVLFGKGAKDKKEPVKTLRLRPGTRCRPIEKKHGRFAFEIIDPGATLDSSTTTRLYGASIVEGSEIRSSETRVWAVSSEDERVRWMRVIEDAAGLEARLEDESFVEEKELNELHAEIAKSRSAEDYLEALGKVYGLRHLSAAQLICELHAESEANGADGPGGGEDDEEENNSVCCSASLASQADNGSVVDVCSGDTALHGSKRVDVPVAWVHDKLHLPRGGISNDSTMMQILKDMQRDTIVINGKHFEGHSELVGKRSAGSSGSFASPAVCSIVCEIAREIQRHSLEVELTEAEALELAHQVLMTCNRTQSGGNTLDAVSVLCANSEFSFVAADTSVPTQPLQIRVYNAPRVRRLPLRSETSPRSGEGGHRHAPYRRGSRRSRASSQPQPDELAKTSKNRDHQGSPLKLDSSDLLYRKTSSDGDFSATFADLSNEDANTNGAGASTNDSQDPRSSSTTPAKGAHAAHHPEFRLSLSKLRHRRRASEPLQLDMPLTALADAAAQQEHQQRLETHSGTDLEELNPAPRVDICVVMHYKLCNVNFQDESDAVWARVRARFRRTFALVGQRKTVALGQGTISLSLLKKNGPPLHE